jgi:hypothetical protein
VAVSKTLPGEDEVGSRQQDCSAFIGGALGWLTYVHPERAGIIADALVVLGVPPHQAGFYEKHLRTGSLLVCIRSSSTEQFDCAAAALLATGAESVVAAQPAARPQNGRAIRPEIPHADRLVETVFTC